MKLKVMRVLIVAGKFRTWLLAVVHDGNALTCESTYYSVASFT